MKTFQASQTFRLSCSLAVGLLLVLAAPVAFSQSTTLATSSEDYSVTAVRSDIQSFAFDIELDVPLVAGRRYENPPILSMNYSVVGQLVENTPSGFPGFNLMRELDGEEFYAQGSSLTFEIADSAVLDDGVQIIELAGEAVVFLFDGREIGTGRFHPARLELRANGVGLLQNSNNQPGDGADSTIAAGSEYIMDLAFDPGNTTVLRVTGSEGDSLSGGGAAVFTVALLPWLLVLYRRRRGCSRRGCVEAYTGIGQRMGSTLIVNAKFRR